MRNRRGLSTVVGAVFFVIAATTVISYISYSMNTIDQFAESVIVKEAENINRGLEHITISKISIDGGEFNMTVVNTGSLPVHLTRLWITDENSALPDQKLDLDVRINPGKEAIKIGQGITADSSISYSLKVVTERGNLATFQVSPDVSTQLQLVAPAAVDLLQDFRVTAYITNNSIKPNNIANLVPILKTNVTLTQVNGPLPPSIQTLLQGNTAVFTWTYQAPALAQGVSFNVTYVGAPDGLVAWSNMTAAKSGEAELAGTSDWSQAAKRVGILISGVPDPVESSGSASAWMGKWGIGIINPLDRPVYIYSVGILTAVKDIFFDDPVEHEPADGNWRHASLGEQGMILWEGGSSPVTVPPKSVAQFRVETEFKTLGSDPVEGTFVIQALTSEGKMSTIYTISAFGSHPTINVFYTTDISIPYPTTDWGYLIDNIPSGKIGQIFNATVENSSDNDLTSEVILIILLPSDFTNVSEFGNSADWDEPIIVTNPDGSNVITVNTTATTLVEKSQLIFQFQADVPVVSEKKLYVFQTTAIYPDWDDDFYDQIQLASALSEAGVQVVP